MSIIRDSNRTRGPSAPIVGVVVGALALLFQGGVYAASSALLVEPSLQQSSPGSSSDADQEAHETPSIATLPDATTNSDSIAYAQTASQSFGTVDLKTGVFKKLGTSAVLLSGMGVANGKLYAAGYKSGTLYTVNPSNGTLTEVGSSAVSYSVFGSTTGSGLYGADTAQRLYSIDPSNGAATLIGPLGVNYSGYWALSVNSPTLYFSNDTNLYTVDTATGEAKLVGSLGKVSLGALLLEDDVLWGGQETPGLAVATVNPSTGAAKTGPAFTGTGTGLWWAIAPSPVPPVVTSTSLKVSATSVTSGKPVSFTALVTSVPGTSTPTGKVSFIDGSKTRATVTMNGTGQATYSTSSLAVGTHSIEAKYLGTSSDKTSTSSAVSVVIEGIPSAKLSATSIAFGNETVDKKSANKTVTLTNVGSAKLSFSSIKLTGSQADDFAMTTTCGSTLAANASCTMSIAFLPVSSGAKSAILSIADNAAGSPQTVALAGTGVSAGSAPMLKVSASSLAFGDQSVKTTSTSKFVTLSNTGTGALTISSITLTGGQADDFGLTKTCGTSLSAGASCRITITFTPVSAGAKSASISISDNASGSPQNVSLTGTGVASASAPTIQFTASSIAFSNEAVKKTSASRSVTLSNTGDATLKISSIKLGGGQADDFALSNACGSSLAGGARCTLGVTFTPVSTGAKSASISITDNASGSPQTVSLSGTGV